MITQPTFFPWLGYFDMIDQSDIFVILDDAKFSKRSWHQRNKFKKLFKSTNELEWFTIPVQSEKSDNNINQIKMFNTIKILKEFEKFIQTNYSKSKYFKSYSKNIINTMMLESKKGMLSDLNIGIIKFFLEVLNIKTKIILSSDLSLKGKRSKKTINICEYFKEKIYLSSPGAKEYLIQDAELFKKKGIHVYLHKYDHPIYSQLNPPFIPYASILDLIFNEGEKSIDIIKKGRREKTLLF